MTDRAAMRAAMVRVGRLAARFGRAVAIAVLLPTVAVLQLTIALVVCWPVPDDVLASRGAPLTVVDRRGDVLAVVPAAGGADRDHWVTLTDLPSAAIDAVLVSEDGGFFRHRGVDGVGLARAAWLNLRQGRVGYGGSTLTMQLARILLGTENDRGLVNKAREAVLALRLERAVDKRVILEHWLNRAYFGNGAYGLDAAARLYFGRPATALATGEAVLLAVLPRAPTAYDPLRHLPRALARRDRVLAMMVEAGLLGADAAARAVAMAATPRRHDVATEAPHFVRWVVEQLPADVRAAGGVVHTTLDRELQRLVELRAREHLATLDDRNVDQAGAVVLDAATSEVRAMVGAASFSSAPSEVNITTRRRHPGSALKPFVYAAALERGDHPGTIAYDLRDVSTNYVVQGPAPERGPVRYRAALAASLNFAAIDVLERVGVPRVMTALRAAGVADADGTADDYGLRLALGAAKVRLLDLAAGYGFLVRGGTVRPATGVDWVDRADGRRWQPAPAHDRRVFSPATAWMTMDMLADGAARHDGFGAELPLDLPYPVAAKTGTARGFADTWTVAATRELIVAVWAGNFDGAPTQGVIAMDAAAPIVRDALLAAARGARLTLPARPDDVVTTDVCALSGLVAGPGCPHVRDVAHRGHAPGAPCTWHDADGRVTWPARLTDWLRRSHRVAAR
ncbi:MAG: transglycosylase domain-containing protein [Kofleriaceae bacterium]|nr:transglycosylase domain-containing protein [Kofleriaceae bacterium]